MQLTTINDAINFAFEHFEDSECYFGHGSDNAWDEAVFLVLHVAGKPLDAGEDVLGSTLDQKQQDQIKKMVKKRVNDKTPLPYLINRAFFAGLEFYVDERVIVPRSPLAELIETNFEPYVDMSKVNTVLDMCTGSGCIAIAMAAYFDYVKVDAVDLSQDALDVARINVANHHLEDRVNLIESDLFMAIEHKKYDLIITNPPYVDAEDMGDLPSEYHHEPEMALASGNDGLDATRVIIEKAKTQLNPGGVLICEVGNSARAVDEAFKDLGLQWLEFERGGHGVFLLKI